MDKEYYIYRYFEEDKIIYTGRSENIKNRINQHKREKDLYERTTHIDIMKCDSEADMMVQEVFYINTYQPEFNKHDKGKGNINLVPTVQHEWVKYWDINDNNISHDIAVLEDVSSILIKELFDNKMPVHRINIVHDVKYIRTGFVRKNISYSINDERNDIYAIDVPEEYVYGDWYKCVLTILVGLIDIYYSKYDYVKLHSRNNTYGNSNFKLLAEKHGVICEYDRKHKNSYGWVPVKLKKEVYNLVKDYKVNSINVYKKTNTFKNKNSKKFSNGTTPRKYYDQTTNESVRATKQHILFCLDGHPDDVVEKIINYCESLNVFQMVLD